eukprot:1138389-Pelagomonas_calceolata.AAC.4
MPASTHAKGIQRQDFECTGVRKLEFLVAEAKRLGHDSIVTIGGIQSNHCRATAVAAKANWVCSSWHCFLQTAAVLLEHAVGI